MKKNFTLILIFISVLILLISGIGTSYYWITNVYLPEQINSNIHAKKLVEWEQNDLFMPPEDLSVSQTQLDNFLLVNESLYLLLQRLNKKTPENQWQVVYDMVKLQPEWQAQKYIALKKFGISPKEYDFISNQITKYWISRFKEKSTERIKEMGWQMFSDNLDSTIHSQNYKLFNAHEDRLNSIFTLFLSDDVKNIFVDADTSLINSDSLP